MKLTKGETIDAPVLVSGEPSKARYQVTVKELVYQGEHFNVYLGEDARGAYVCVKTLRYRSEKKDSFACTQDYIQRRRSIITAEHRLLGISHPCLPAPVAMLNLENATAEDQRLFRKIPQWETLKHNEPVLVSEYFTGYRLTQLSDKLRLFPLERRIKILVKVAKLCLFIHQQGYIAQNLHPDNIILKPSHDDNLQLIGLHNACAQKNGEVERDHPGFRCFVGYAPPESWDLECRYDRRADIYQLGVLLYYLITLSDPAREIWGKKVSEHFFDKKKRTRVEKAIRFLDNSAMWLADLISYMVEPLPALRLPDIETLLSYLKRTPQSRVSFKISKAVRDSVEIKVISLPKWSTHIKVRLETIGNSHVITQEFPNAKTLNLPGTGSGRLVCALAATDGNRISWWQYQQKTISPEIQFSVLHDLPPDRFGIDWEQPPELHHVTVVVTDPQGKITHLGEFTGSGALLPPEGTELPYYQPLQMECLSYFQFSGSVVKGNVFCHEVKLYPPVPEPVFREIEKNIELEMSVPKRQADSYIDIEILHNGWPCEAESRRSEEGDREKIVFFLDSDKLDFFERHQFGFRVLIDGLGWRTGSCIDVSLSLPPVTGLKITERQPGWVEITWNAVAHPRLDSYLVECEGEEVSRCRDTSLSMRLPLKTVLQEKKREVSISVYCIYSDEQGNIKSPPADVKFQLGEWRRWLQCNLKQQVSPFFVTFNLEFENYSAVEGLSSVLAFRRQNTKDGSEETLARLDIKPKMDLCDDDVGEGESYKYFLVLEDVDLYLLEQKAEIPPVSIEAKLEKTGYEECLWQISISSATALCIDGQVEIVRSDPEEKHSFQWPKGEEFYYFNDKNLLPGNTYEYVLNVPLCDQSIYSLDMGAVRARKFEIEENIQIGYNYALITWSPSPAGNIDCIELYDSTKRKIGITQSASITLENLEPEKNYRFPLKYRYLSGKVVDGPLLSFTTLPYNAIIEAADIDSSSFRLRWKILDRGIKSKIKGFVLEISGDVGTHELALSTRSVQLRHLCPCTAYQWHLRANLKSGGVCNLGSGEAVTLKPEFKADIEVGLVHHIKWDFPNSPGIRKIEVHRDDTLLLQTTEKEMFDSDFKGGREVTYRFFYLLKNERRLPAAEKTVKALSMKDLYSMVKIETGIGMIHWDFCDLKKFKYLKYVEMFRNGTSAYKQGTHMPELLFENMGETDENGECLGLSGDPIDFQLDIVGVAPIARKCKKKWVLNIKGIQCRYPKFPADFRVIREHSCIYFEWDYTPTKLLKEITLWRAEDGEVIYQGPNEPCLVYDDNQEQGLSPTESCLYCIKMDYKNYASPPENCNDYYDELEKPFDPGKLKSRLEIFSDISENKLEITWNSDLETSIVSIKCRLSYGMLSKFSILSKFFGSSKWVPFEQGQLSVSLPSSSKFQYQLLFQDYFGKEFYAPLESVEDPVYED